MSENRQIGTFHEVLPDNFVGADFRRNNLAGQTKRKIVLQNSIDFYYIHTKESEHFNHNILLSIKNKSGKRKLSRGGG